MMDLDLRTSVILMIQAGVVPTGCETAKSQRNKWSWSSSETVNGSRISEANSACRTATQEYTFKWTVRADHGSCLVADIYFSSLALAVTNSITLSFHEASIAAMLSSSMAVVNKA